MFLFSEHGLERLESLVNELYTVLEAGRMLGKNCSSRSTVLHTVFKLLDRGSARLVLRLARLIIAVRISDDDVITFSFRNLEFYSI